MIDAYGFDREVAFVSLKVFCDYVAASGQFETANLPTLAVACAYLAIKSRVPQGFHEILARGFIDMVHHDNLILSCDDESRPARVRVSLSSVYEMERAIRQTLPEQRLGCDNVPTMHQFASYCMNLHPLLEADAHTDGTRSPFTSEANSYLATHYLFNSVRYQIEEALFHPALLRSYKPSMIVFAALLRAERHFLAYGTTASRGLLTLDMQNEYVHELAPILGLDVFHVRDCMSALEHCVPRVLSWNEFLRGAALWSSVAAAAAVSDDDDDDSHQAIASGNLPQIPDFK